MDSRTAVLDSFSNIPYDTARVTHRRHSGGNVTRDDTACTNDGARAYRDAGQDDRAAHPYIRSDVERFSVFFAAPGRGSKQECNLATVHSRDRDPQGSFAVLLSRDEGRAAHYRQDRRSGACRSPTRFPSWERSARRTPGEDLRVPPT